MKSIVLRLVLALAAFTIVPNALADTASGNFFVDGKVGTTFGKEVSNDSGYNSGSQLSWGADGGYRWNLDDARSLGLDVGYMHFGHIADEVGNLGSSEVSASVISLGGQFQYLFGDDKAWLFQVDAGFLSLKSDANSSSFEEPSTSSTSSRKGGTYFGLGIGRYITQSVSLILVLDRYSSNGDQFGPNAALDLNWIGLEAEYRF